MIKKLIKVTVALLMVIMLTLTIHTDYCAYAATSKAISTQSIKYNASNETMTIISGKAKYEFKHHVDSKRQLDTWRITRGDVVDKYGNLIGNMFVDSDIEGAIEEKDAKDYIGGFHGDETYLSVKVIVDGKKKSLKTDFKGDYKKLEISVASTLYHCNTTDKAFSRCKTLIFTDNKLTVTNQYTTLSSFYAKQVATCMFLINKNYKSNPIITEYSDNVGDDNVSIPTDNTKTKKILSDVNLDSVSIVGTGFNVDVKIIEGKSDTYTGSLVDFVNRFKVYFYPVVNTQYNEGDEFSSSYEVKIY